MTLEELAELIKRVLLSPEVIGVTVVIALYVNIVNYIVRYRKRPPVPRVKKTKPASDESAKTEAKTPEEKKRTGNRPSAAPTDDEATG